MSAREKVDLEAPTPDDDECYCDFASREYFGCFDRSHDPLCPQAEPPPQTPKEALPMTQEMRMSDTTNFRRERIDKLLHELRYEIERGMMERDIGEEMGFRFYVPISNKIPDGVVFCEFRTRPIPRHLMSPDDLRPKLELVK